jgi:hypothetical protein
MDASINGMNDHFDTKFILSGPNFFIQTLSHNVAGSKENLSFLKSSPFQIK